MRYSQCLYDISTEIFSNISVMRIYFSILLSCFLSISIAGQETWKGPAVDMSQGRLAISNDGRHLVFGNGESFFYLGDTAWELFHRLNREEAENYLENRRSKGFTVIQAVVLAELDGLNDPNPYGHMPLIDNDPTKPNEAYFEHVDWIIKKAKEKGLYIGLLPTWGDKVDKKWGIGPVIFNEENAEVYGRWIAERYRSYENIIWINGGDRSGGDGNTAVWNAMGRAIKEADPEHLMTFHPWGGHSSSAWFHNEDWLDFNMIQTGHSDRSIANFRFIEKDRNLKPVKPTLDGEPCYEDHAIKWDPKYGWFDAADVRRQLYWSVFSGGCGVTYGAHPIWQMYDEGRKPITHARNYWHEVLDLPGAQDVLHLRQLVESFDWLNSKPSQELLVDNKIHPRQKILAIQGKDFACLYLPVADKIGINQSKLFGTVYHSSWFNPRTAERTHADPEKQEDALIYSPPTYGIDWVLIIQRKVLN